MKMFINAVAGLAVIALASPVLAQTQTIKNLGAIEAAAAKRVSTPKISLEGQFTIAAETDAALYYLRWPVERQGDVVLAYTLEILESSEKLDNGKLMLEAVSAYALNCATSTARVIGEGSYDIKGDLVGKDDGVPDTLSFKPDSVMGGIAKIACGGKPKDEDLMASRADAEIDAESLFDLSFLDEVEDALAKPDAPKK